MVWKQREGLSQDWGVYEISAYDLNMAFCALFVLLVYVVVDSQFPTVSKSL